MAYFVYILYSKTVNRYYVGHCQDLEDRIGRHNGDRSKFTKMAKDREVKHSEIFSTRAEAMAREKEIKGKKSRMVFLFLAFPF